MFYTAYKITDVRPGDVVRWCAPRHKHFVPVGRVTSTVEAANQVCLTFTDEHGETRTRVLKISSVLTVKRDGKVIQGFPHMKRPHRYMPSNGRHKLVTAPADCLTRGFGGGRYSTISK
jgi:hypothetical protein